MATVTSTANVDEAGVLFAGNALQVRPDDFPSRLRRARVGVAVLLVAVAMIFVSYSSAYVVRQGLPSLDPRSGTLVRDWIPLRLPGFLLINTLVLLVSTLTMELARRQSLRTAAVVRSAGDASSGDRLEADGYPWLSITAILGVAFLCGQWLVWRELAARGFYLATSASSSFFYLLTAMHGVHLLGGIVALFIAAGAAFLRINAQRRAIISDGAAWYWHFLAVLWVYLLCLFEFAH